MNEAPGSLKLLGETPLKGVRRTIAARLGGVWRDAVHVTLQRELDVTPCYENKERLTGSLIDYMLYGFVQTLRETRFASFNAHFDGHTLRAYSSINIGLATDHPKGLIVPVLHGVEAMEQRAFAAARKELVSRAREWRHSPQELEGGTVTVSNLGTLGIGFFTPILNPPQTAILGIGATRVAPVIRQWGEAPQARALVPVSLTVDHRVLDGADAARLLQRLQEHIEALVAAEQNGTRP